MANEHLQKITRQMCFQTLHGMLKQSSDNTKEHLSQFFERKPLSEAMISISALYLSTCDMALKNFCAENDLTDTYESSINQILTGSYNNKTIQSIKSCLDRNSSTNITEMGDKVTEGQIRRHVKPYAESVNNKLGVDKKDVKEALFNMLVNTMTQILKNSASFVILVRNPVMAGASK